MALKTEPHDKRPFLPVGTKTTLLIGLQPRISRESIGGVGALAGTDYMNDYVRWQALPSLWQSGLVYFPEPGSYISGIREHKNMAMLLRPANNEPSAFALPDGDTENWGVPARSWSAENNSGGGSGPGYAGGQSSGGSGSPQGGPAQASAAKSNSSTTALSNGIVRAQPGGASAAPSMVPGGVPMLGSAAIISSAPIYAAYAVKSTTDVSVPSWAFGNSASGGGFVFDVNTMVAPRWTPVAANAPEPVAGIRKAPITSPVLRALGLRFRHGCN